MTIQKFDPYINVDAGTMNPFEHGEVYVTDDGAETDLDLGHYERYLGVPMSQANNVTTGRVYSGVIAKERAGAYLGKTVQVVPHVIDEIKGWMRRLAETGDYDVIVTEVGGTAGDIESLPYLEAIRQLSLEEGKANAALSTSRWSRTSPRPASSRPSRPSTRSRRCNRTGCSPTCSSAAPSTRCPTTSAARSASSATSGPRR